MKQYTYVIFSLFLLTSVPAIADEQSRFLEMGNAQDQHIIVTDRLDADLAGCLVESGVNFEVFPAEKGDGNPTLQNGECEASCAQQRFICKQYHDPELCDAWWNECMLSCGGFN